MRLFIIVFFVTCAGFFGATQYLAEPLKDQPMVIIGYQDE